MLPVSHSCIFWAMSWPFHILIISSAGFKLCYSSELRKKKYSFSFLLIFIIYKNQSGWIWGKNNGKMGRILQSKAWRLDSDSKGVKSLLVLAAVAQRGDKTAPRACTHSGCWHLGVRALHLLCCRQGPGHLQRALKYPLTISSGR